MTKIDIFSGFLGAGKTTLIKKLIKEAYTGEKVVLIENEFGEIGIDGGFLKDAGVEITEMNSGCICCSLVGDFGEALKKVLKDFTPDRILIEPSGVGKLSDVIKAVKDLDMENVTLNGFTTVADAGKCKMYMKNFGEFYNDQIKHAGCIILSHTQTTTEEKLKMSVELISELNKDAVIVTTPWDKLSGKQLLDAIERQSTLENVLNLLKEEHEDICPECGHHHDHEHEHHHHDECCHDHEHEHHHHDECCHDHEHEHHHHDECCHDHEHGHHHHDECCHDHEHGHHHHHAYEVFTSWGVETTNKYSKEEIKDILNKLSDEEEFGVVLRAKGIVECICGNFIHFDYIPNEADVREGSADITGRICVIGSKLNEEHLAQLFRIN